MLVWSRAILSSVATTIIREDIKHGLYRGQPQGKALVAQRDPRRHLDGWTMDSLSQVKLRILGIRCTSERVSRACARTRRICKIGN